MMDLLADINELGRRAREAALTMAQSSSDQRSDALAKMARSLEAAKPAVLTANAVDLERAAREDLAASFVDRLRLDDARFAAMVEGLRVLSERSDPVGEILRTDTRPNGLVISKVRVPIGVIAVIYESRPNVTADAAGLCIRSSNAVILRGGKESIATSGAIFAALREGLVLAGLPADAVQMVETTDREAVRALVQLEQYVDVAIPRGGESLIRAVTEAAKVPVLKHYKGICAIYVDESADLGRAVEICENAKCQRPGVCNAMETLLVHQRAAGSFLPALAARLGEQGVELRGDEHARSVVPEMVPAEPLDWETEFLDLRLAVKVVAGLDEAIGHINTYGSRHTDAIIASNASAIEAFVARVDSGVVMVNASTRFNDGGEFGLGAEMGISTDKLHARGPVGADELTTYKYIVRGSGQIRG